MALEFLWTVVKAVITSRWNKYEKYVELSRKMIEILKLMKTFRTVWLNFLKLVWNDLFYNLIKISLYPDLILIIKLYGWSFYLIKLFWFLI